MKYEVTIQNKTYSIECGEGLQPVFWLAMQACLLYGQETYPKGFYVPTRAYGLTTNPHPQSKLKECYFQDFKVFVTIRQSGKAPTEEEKLWYERAFGSLRHMITIKYECLYDVNTSRPEPHELRFYYKIKEKFPEYMTLYNESLFTWKNKVTLKKISIDEKQITYIGEVEVPCATYDLDLYEWDPINDEKKIQKDKGGNNPNASTFFHPSFTYIPQPESEEMRKRFLQDEIEKDKRKEEEIQLKQKAMKVEMAKKKKEREKQFLIMQKIANKLGTVWEKMKLEFIQSKEEAEVTLQTLIKYYNELYSIYTFYTGFSNQFVLSHENDYILVQQFIHFLKEYKFCCTNMRELYQIIKELEVLLGFPIKDSLNLMNGMNFAKFIEGILRIAYYNLKLEQEKEENIKNEEGASPKMMKKVYDLGSSLNFMIQFHLIPRKEEIFKDPIKIIMSKSSIICVFKKYLDLLSGVFAKSGSPMAETEYELKKSEFIAKISDLKLLDKEKITKFNLENMMKSSFSIASDNLNFMEFLEMILRVALEYPFTPDQLEEIKTEELKLEFVISRFAERYKDEDIEFRKKINENTEVNGYTVDLILPDEEENPNKIEIKEDSEDEKSVKSDRSHSDQNEDDKDKNRDEKENENEKNEEEDKDLSAHRENIDNEEDKKEVSPDLEENPKNEEQQNSNTENSKVEEDKLIESPKESDISKEKVQPSDKDLNSP